MAHIFPLKYKNSSFKQMSLLKNPPKRNDERLHEVRNPIPVQKYGYCPYQLRNADLYSWLQRRTPRVPVRGLLVGVGGAQHGRLVERRAHDL